MSERDLRKQFLIAEIELSRHRLIEDFSSLSERCRQIRGGADSLKAVVSSGALLVAGLAAYQRSRQKTHGGKTSWLKTLLKGAGLASTVWLALQAPARKR